YGIAEHFTKHGLLFCVDAHRHGKPQLREGKSHTTANLALKTLRSLFNDARREGLISVNPAEAVRTFGVEKEARDVFTHNQLRKLIKAAEAEWRTPILLAYYSGLRLSDAVSLTWENVS